MQFLWQRYARSGYAPWWFYAAIGMGFAALGAWAAVRGDWVVLAAALIMVPVTVAGARVMRRLHEAAEASRERVESGKDHEDG